MHHLLDAPAVAAQRLLCHPSSAAASAPLLGSAFGSAFAAAAGLALLHGLPLMPALSRRAQLLAVALLALALAAAAHSLAHERLLGTAWCEGAVVGARDAARALSDGSLAWAHACSASAPVPTSAAFPADVDAAAAAAAAAPDDVLAGAACAAAASSLPSWGVDRGAAAVASSAAVALVLTVLASRWARGLGRYAALLAALAAAAAAVRAAAQLASTTDGGVPSAAAVLAPALRQALLLAVSYVFRAEAVAVLAPAALAARLVLPAAWLAGAPMADVAAFALLLAASGGSLLWRYQVGVAQPLLLRGVRRALALGAQKSLVVVLVQFLTQVPLHSPLLLPLAYVLDADVAAWRAVARQRRAWWARTLKAVGVLGGPTPAPGRRSGARAEDETEVALGSSSVLAPAFRARLGLVGVSAVAAVCLAMTCWAVALLLRGAPGGAGLHGLNLHTTRGASARSSSTSALPAEPGLEVVALTVCQRAADLGGSWGIPQAEALSGAAQSAYSSAPQRALPEPNYFMRLRTLAGEAAVAAGDALFVATGGGVALQCSTGTGLGARGALDTPHALLACGVARGALAFARLVMLPAVGVLAILLRLLAAVMQFAAPLMAPLLAGRSVRVAFAAAAAAARAGVASPISADAWRSASGLAGDAALLPLMRGLVGSGVGHGGVGDAEPGLRAFGRLPLALSALDDDALPPWAMLQCLCLLAGLQLLLRGPPAEGLQRTLAKAWAGLTCAAGRGTSRAASRAREQRDAYAGEGGMAAEAGDVAQDWMLALPALGAAPQVCLLLWSAWSLIALSSGGGSGRAGAGAGAGRARLFRASWPGDAFDDALLPSPLVALVLLLFVASCLVPRHRSMELLRGAVALSHAVVGGLLLTAALFLMRSERTLGTTYVAWLAPASGEAAGTWSLCTRLRIVPHPAALVHGTFLLVVVAGVATKIGEWWTAITPEDAAELRRAGVAGASVVEGEDEDGVEEVFALAGETVADPEPPATAGARHRRGSFGGSAGRAGGAAVIPSGVAERLLQLQREHDALLAQHLRESGDAGGEEDEDFELLQQQSQPQLPEGGVRKRRGSDAFLPGGGGNNSYEAAAAAAAAAAAQREAAAGKAVQQARYGSWT